VWAVAKGLTEVFLSGQVLIIPARAGNLYVVRGGESKTLLCGSPESFERKNATVWLYPAQEIFL